MQAMVSMSKTKSDPGSARKLLFELQVEQHHHDENYHREIARLSMHQRLNHMALHFAKYAGKVALAGESAPAAMAVYIDTLIIVLSTANILNANLWELVERDDKDFPGLLAFGRSLAAGMKGQIEDRPALLRETIIAAGRMAAACEKIDHLEEVSFRAEIKESIARLGIIALAIISSRGADPAQAVRARLAEVRTRFRLHGRI